MFASFLGVGEEVAEATKRWGMCSCCQHFMVLHNKYPLKALACRAMQGDVSFEDSLELRLGLMQPSADQVQDFLEAHPAHLSPGKTSKACCVLCLLFEAQGVRHSSHADVADLIFEMQRRGTDIFLVSGGFRAIIHPIAETLHIPIDNVYANTILFEVRAGPAHRALSPPHWGIGLLLSRQFRHAIAACRRMGPMLVLIVVNSPHVLEESMLQQLQSR